MSFQGRKRSRKRNTKEVESLAEKTSTSKFKNKKVKLDDYTFDSKREGNRYLELKKLAEDGAIQEFKVKPRLKLVAGIGYIPDFSYLENGKVIVEDVKGFLTDVFKLKKKLFHHSFPDWELRLTW